MREGACVHLRAVGEVKVSKRRECEECVNVGSGWMHPRTCQECGA